MKRIFSALLLIVALFSCNSTLYAQRGDKQRMTREQLAEKQANYIAKELAMDDATSAKFISTFCQFQKEVWELGPRPKRESPDRSDAETGEKLKGEFERSQKLLDLRKKYYQEYSKFLTQKQIERVYQLEKDTMERLHHRSQKGKRPAKTN